VLVRCRNPEKRAKPWATEIVKGTMWCEQFVTLPLQ
jgi:hypothetical protein